MNVFKLKVRNMYIRKNICDYIKGMISDFYDYVIDNDIKTLPSSCNKKFVLNYNNVYSGKFESLYVKMNGSILFVISHPLKDNHQISFYDKDVNSIIEFFEEFYKLEDVNKYMAFKTKEIDDEFEQLDRIYSKLTHM